MLTKVKVLLGIADNTKDDLLEILIDQTINEVVEYTHDARCGCILENIICEMVVYKTWKFWEFFFKFIELFCGVVRIIQSNNFFPM